MTSPMVEKMARAICQSAGIDPDKAAIADDGTYVLTWTAFAPAARAALEAMREPTMEMVKAYCRAEGDDTCGLLSEDAWRVMIDAALAEG